MGIKCRHQGSGSADRLAAGCDISNDPVHPSMANGIITYMSLKAPKLSGYIGSLAKICLFRDIEGPKLVSKQVATKTLSLAVFFINTLEEGKTIQTLEHKHKHDKVLICVALVIKGPIPQNFSCKHDKVLVQA